MPQPSVLLALSLVCSGCTRSALAVLVPKLDVRCVVVVRDRDDRVLPETASVAASVGAALRWQSTVEARALPSAYEASAVAWTLPCSDDDQECLRELFEAEASVAAALREEP